MGEAAAEEEAPPAAAAGAQGPEVDEQGSLLAAAMEAVSSLVSDSLSASLFPHKWQLIRDKLHRLHAGLADISVADADPSFTALLRGVAATAREGLDLVPRSQGRHYGGGKLRLRSDLDVLASALDAHAAALDEAQHASSGALGPRAGAIVVPRPPPGAARDDVRFYVRDLFARARVGGGRMRREAAAALAELLRGGDGERCARVVVESGDGVGVLVALLECGDAGAREEALDAVSAIAGFDAHRTDLVVGGVVAPVVRVLDGDAGGGVSPADREKAARVLGRLTENSDNAWAVAAHGGVTALLNACDNNSGGSELACAACRVLRNLAGVDEIRKYMVADASAVPVLVSLISRQDDASQIQATELLAAMAAGDASVRDAVIRSGAVEALVRALDPNSSTPRSSKSREVALRAIDALCFPASSSPTCAATTDRLLAAGFLDRVLALLRSDDAVLQHCALKSAHRLCHASEDTRKAMGDAGLMPELVAVFIDAMSPEKARETAAEALCALVATHRNRKRFVHEDRGGVAQVVRALRTDEEKTSATTRFLLATLAHVAESSSGRRKIVSSEHFRYEQHKAKFDALTYASSDCENSLDLQTNQPVIVF